ncbi:cytochrome c oxidase assembly factor 3 homolog, mitochondrial [Lethenteron reissneri]|uniref:cytochrome c oxidase assembly factor 3 homolog, mitochondrial n=1 Tax=Lethenteron reissneri TaxID=7753 RepID=UPI002AB68B66|nr:cytochrome c oxidase assembly factor 3 homolog, mitochondrial [Lethenteron reissneri]
MAAQGGGGGGVGDEGRIAQRVDSKRAGELSQEQVNFMRTVEREQLRRNVHRLRGRNIGVALGLGAVVLGIYGYTFYSVGQERFLDDIDDEVKAAKARSEERHSNN